MHLVIDLKLCYSFSLTINNIRCKTDIRYLITMVLNNCIEKQVTERHKLVSVLGMSAKMAVNGI